MCLLGVNLPMTSESKQNGPVLVDQKGWELKRAEDTGSAGRRNDGTLLIVSSWSFTSICIGEGDAELEGGRSGCILGSAADRVRQRQP